MPNSGQAIAKNIILYRIFKRCINATMCKTHHWNYEEQHKGSIGTRPTPIKQQPFSKNRSSASNEIKLQYSEFKLYILPNLCILKPMTPKLCFEAQPDELSI